MAVEVADALSAQGKSVSLVSVHTLKPLDRAGIVDVLKRHKQVILVEETAPLGGLSAQTKQIAWDSGASCRIDVFSLQDAFVDNNGTWEDLLAAHGLSTPKILAAVA